MKWPDFSGFDGSTASEDLPRPAWRAGLDHGEALGQQIKVVASDATVVILKNTRRWVLEENPKRTTDALINFL
jgi:hypothetical protein